MVGRGQGASATAAAFPVPGLRALTPAASLLGPPLKPRSCQGGGPTGWGAPLPGRPAPAGSRWRGRRRAGLSRLLADASWAATRAPALPPRPATHSARDAPAARGGGCSAGPAAAGARTDARAGGRTDGRRSSLDARPQEAPPARPPAAVRPTPAPPPAPRRIPERAPGGGTPTPRFSAPGRPQAPTRSPAAPPGAAYRRWARVPGRSILGTWAVMPGPPPDAPGSPQIVTLCTPGCHPEHSDPT